MTTNGTTKSPNTDALSDRWIDLRLISMMRLVLSASALLIVLIEPPRRGPTWPYYAGLLLYTLYSLGIYFVSVRRVSLVPQNVLHWLDLLWYLALFAFSMDSGSLFFFFFFFPILVSSFGWGFSAGLRTTFASAVLLTTIGLLVSANDPDFQLNRFLLRPISLLALGYMIAHWGGFEVKLKRRLRILKDISSLSDPRFGLDKTVHGIMEELRRFYAAESCLMVMADQDNTRFQLRRVNGPLPAQALCQDIANEMAALLLSPSPSEAVIFHTRESKRLLYNVRTSEGSNELPQNCATVANTLEADSYLSVPIDYQRRPAGRLYLVGSSQTLDDSDISFVLQLIEQVTPLLDNIRLVDRLASDAAEQERHRIARDIHDGVIQPYIGLQFGLAAIRQKLDRGDNNIADDVRSLSEMTVSELDGLRGYVRGLKTGERHDAMLLPAIRRFAAKFSAATGIAVDVQANEDDIPLKDRFAAEIFQMVSEGFSNIRRHTQSSRAGAEIDCSDDLLVLRIRNENTNGCSTVNFYPRSLAERAATLGGQLEVYLDEQRQTVVSVQIPL